MSTTLSSGRLRSSARRSTSKKSVLMSRSCTSSIMTCDTPRRPGSRINRRSSTPVVTNSTLAPSSLGAQPCRRTLKPTELPARSPRSPATRSATETAAMRRGCVTMIRVSGPTPRATASSRMYCGHWVDLPLPVPPDTTTTRFVRRASQSSVRIFAMGRASRVARILASAPAGSASAAAARAVSSATKRSLSSRLVASSRTGLRDAPDTASLRLRYPPSTTSAADPSDEFEFASPVASSSSSTRSMYRSIARSSASLHARMRASWSSGVPIASISASMASSGSGGTRNAATLPPGDRSTNSRSASCLPVPTTARRTPPSTRAPYAASSASPFPEPTPTLSTFLPPSTYADTVACQLPPFAFLYSTLGLDELTSSSMSLPSSARSFCCALSASLTIRATFGGSCGSIAPALAALIDRNASRIARRCDSALLKSKPPP
mmetsp:Transcript_10902/g.47188  ORF Transcript_10902/g.47188 Transcript_10902/m.47188 type:complete len:436 (-) Transcript_10902:742-2049(-)